MLTWVVVGCSYMLKPLYEVSLAPCLARVHGFVIALSDRGDYLNCTSLLIVSTCSSCRVHGGNLVSAMCWRQDAVLMMFQDIC
jgi:hypothetical protein